MLLDGLSIIICASGISGNMFLDAYLQLGVPENYPRKKPNLPHEYTLEISDGYKNILLIEGTTINNGESIISTEI